MSNAKTKEALDSAKESGKGILDGGKDIGKGVRNVTKGTGKSLASALKCGYHLVDAGDHFIGEKIEKRQKKKGKDTSGKVKSFVRNNIAKTLIATSLLTQGGIKAYHKINDKKDDQKEVVVEQKSYFDNPDFFVEDFELTKDVVYQKQGVELIRDAGMSFYVVQKGDSLNFIRDKLSKIPEFSYLADSLYVIPDDVSRNINSFNVPKNAVQPGMFLPIPVKIEDRQIEIKQFKEYSRTALDQMKNNKYYGDKIKEILKQHSEDEIVDVMTAFARSETSEDRSKFSDLIGSVELHRREPGLQAFSFSYYHILMEFNADGKTMGPGLKARTKLGLTEGQCYHPVNAGKLFLGYCCEKRKKDPGFFFNINNLDAARSVGGVYNGDKAYGNKLWENLKEVKKS